MQGRRMRNDDRREPVTRRKRRQQLSDRSRRFLDAGDAGNAPPINIDSQIVRFAEMPA